MTNVIIGIHGLANKPDKPTITQWWDASIREGLSKNHGVQDADFELVMVYWADLLYEQHQQHEDLNAPFYNRQPYVEAQGELKEYRDGLLEYFRATLGSIFGPMLDSLRRLVGIDPFSDALLEAKFRDLDFYYDPSRQIKNREGQPEVARKVLMDELTNIIKPLRGQRMMLIAHSMGSIISYDVLRDLGRVDSGFPVHRFVTIGSPLGIGLVKENVERERAYAAVPLRTPTIVTERWVNYADHRDVVAVDPHLRDDYAANDRGIRVEDDIVSNDYVSPYGEKNSHKSYGYLRTPELSRHIHEFIES